MSKIQLPSKGKDNQIENKEDETQKTRDDTALKTQIAGLSDQMGAMTQARKNTEDAEARVAKEDEAKQLAAEADLASLLRGEGEKPVEDSRTTRVNDLSNAELLDVISTAVDTSLQARLEQSSHDVDGKIKKTNDTVESICKLLGKMQASAGLREARTKYSDFDTFKDDTLAVLDTYPLMEIEHAYLLAKQLRKADSPAKNQTDSERPTRTPFGDFSGRERETKATEKTTVKSSKSSSSGVVGFRNLVNAAVDKVVSGKTYEGS